MDRSAWLDGVSVSVALMVHAPRALPCPPLQLADCQWTLASFVRLPEISLRTRAASRNTTWPPAAMLTGTPSG